MSDQSPALVGLKDCGCLVAAMVDEPKYRRHNAGEVAALMRQGYTIERVTVEQARALPWCRSGGACEHDPAEGQVPGQEALVV